MQLTYITVINIVGKDEAGRKSRAELWSWRNQSVTFWKHPSRVQVS